MPINENDLDDLLNRHQSAALLHTSVSSLDRLIKAKRIEVIRSGPGRGRILITRRALVDYLNRSSIKAASKGAAS